MDVMLDEYEDDGYLSDIEDEGIHLKNNYNDKIWTSRVKNVKVKADLADNDKTTPMATSSNLISPVA
ncbi:hypothetical protein HDE_07947 [Halotydeus destructor]|nr:hypothetical protein HDE_07947 [Halotydeus destructor]